METIEVVIPLLSGVLIGLALSAIHDHLCQRQFTKFRRAMEHQTRSGVRVILGPLDAVTPKETPP